ncbi:MAG: hypothetical protein ACRDYA_20270 [Egibacteraceae bacterium]
MRTIAWVTGRAAAGKSTLIAACVTRLRSRGCEPLVLSDEEVLFQLKEADVEHRHHYHPYGDGRFLFRDGYLFDEGLRRINVRLLDAITSGPSDIVLVELARGAAATVADVSYRRALDLVHPQVWAQSLVFYLDVSYQVQVERNHARVAEKRSVTPEQVMRDLYIRDDHESLTSAGITVHTVPAGCPAKETAAMILTLLGVGNHRNGIPSLYPDALRAAQGRGR